MKGSRLTGTLECWRPWWNGEDIPVDVAIILHVWPVHSSEGRGFEVDVVDATAEGQPFELTPAEVERAVSELAP